MIGGPGLNRSFYDAAKARAAQLPNVEFKGFMPLAEVETWFDRARVFVNTSLYEGMPNTFLQAWSRGIPTVATVDVGAPVHKVGSTVEDLQQQIEEAFNDQQLGERCREYFQRTHSSAEVLSRYEQLFEAIA
jgi:glycosyltransferase involved in cell wall biosynthesis